MKNFFRLLKYARRYWWLMGTAGVSLLAITALNLVTPWLVRELVSALTEGRGDILSFIRSTAVILVAAYVSRAVFTYLYRYLSHVAAWNLVSDMRVKVYEHLQKLSLRYYHDKQTGQLMSRTINDTASLEVFIAHAIPDLLTNGLIVIGISVILFIINPSLAAMTLIPIPLLVLSGLIFTKKILPNFREAQSNLADLNAVVQDNISGIKEIQVFNQQSREKKRVEKKSKKYASAILHALKLSAVFHPAVEMVSAFGTVIVVGFGGWLAVNGYLSAADIVGFVLYLGLFYQPIAVLARVVEDLQQAAAGAERVFELLDTEPDISDGENSQTLERSMGEIRFENVSFYYTRSNPVLKNISFTVKPGQMVAFVGPTGVGKTTIISLIARFYDPVEGRVLLDGMDLKHIKLSSLRNQISIVLQDIFLFNGSVAENIAYGSKSASFDDIVRAARIAGAHDFIRELPQGYDTVIGERGTKLSGGQKQRLSIARAVLRDTPILILDEATASVDVQTEMRIQQAMQQLAGSRTIIVIAHRLSTVKQADNIIVLKDGEIVESGNHNELLRHNGLYKSLYDVQFQPQELLPDDEMQAGKT